MLEQPNPRMQRIRNSRVDWGCVEIQQSTLTIAGGVWGLFAGQLMRHPLGEQPTRLRVL